MRQCDKVAVVLLLTSRANQLCASLVLAVVEASIQAPARAVNEFPFDREPGSLRVLAIISRCLLCVVVVIASILLARNGKLDVEPHQSLVQRCRKLLSIVVACASSQREPTRRIAANGL